MLLETRSKGAGVKQVLDQHKCYRERAKLEFLVTQKIFKKREGWSAGGLSWSQAGLLLWRRQA